MKVQLLVCCVGLMALGAIGQNEDQTGKPSLVVSEKNEIRAKVQAIDHDKRELTLKGPKGNTVKMKISDEVRNFSEIKKGDEVSASYYEAAVISLAKEGEDSSEVEEEEAIYRAQPGQKPAGLATKSTRITATVENVNAEKREVTLKGPTGESTTLQVDEKVGDLKRIKKGDRVSATYIEALAIAVEKPEK